MGKRLFPTFVKYVSQSVMGMVGISCYILADTWFVAAAFGAEGLAALNLAIVVYSLMNAAGLMAGIGGATLFSLSFAAGRERRTEIFSSTAALGLFFAVIFTGAGLFFSGGIARLLGADEVIFAMTRSELSVSVAHWPGETPAVGAGVGVATGVGVAVAASNTRYCVFT